MIAVFIIVEIPYGWAAWRSVVTGKGWYFGAMGLFVVIVPWGWLWDIFSGFYHPTILQWPLPQQDNQELSFWHISHSDPNNFNDGIQLNVANTVFLGEGFYSWARAQDCAQALAKHPKVIIRITIRLDQWKTLTVLPITSKWSVAYMSLSYLWTASHVIPRSMRQHILAPCLNRIINRIIRNQWRRMHGDHDSAVLTNIISEVDIVIAPAIGMAWDSRQVLWRNTARCREVLSTADMLIIPVQERS